MCRVVIAVGLSFLLHGMAGAPGTAFATVHIVTCGQDVPNDEDGNLTVDLTCPASGLGVHLGKNTRLHLNGHTISGGAIGVYTHAGYTEIEGPGTITGATEVGIYAPNNEGRHKVFIHDGVELSGHGLTAIALGQGNRVKLILDDVSLHDNLGGAIGNCNGLMISGVDLTVANNLYGLCGDAISLLRSEVENNAGIGIFSWKARVRLKDSTVTGNDPINGWDIATTRKPKLVGVSSCGHSVVVPKVPGLPTPASPSWGVCVND